MNDELMEASHEKELSDRDLKKECFMYARKNFQGQLFTNADTGQDILVSRDGLDEWYSRTKSREQSLSIKKLDVIIMESKKYIPRRTEKIDIPLTVIPILNLK